MINEAEAREIRAKLNQRLDTTVVTVAEAITVYDRDLGATALALALTAMTPADVIDLAFSAVLRLADQEIAASE